MGVSRLSERAVAVSRAMSALYVSAREGGRAVELAW